MESFLEHQIGYSEYITGNRFIDICDESEATFCKTDYLHFFKNTKQRVFVTHNSDYHINSKATTFGPECDYWYAQNKDCNDERIIPIPIGLENIKLRKTSSSHHGLFSSEVKGAHQKALLLDKINGFCVEKQDLVYMNFNIKTYPKERQYVWDKFSQENWVTKTNNLSMEKFLMHFQVLMLKIKCISILQ